MHAAVIRNWRECMDNAREGLPDGGPEYAEIGGVTACRYPALPEDDFSNLAILGDAAEASAIADIAAFFREGGVRGYLWVPGWAASEATAEALHDAGFAFKAPMAAQWGRPEDVPAGPEADVRSAATPAQLADFADANAAGWEAEPDARAAVDSVVARHPVRETWRMFTAYVNGAPAAAAILGLYDGGIGYLADACTDPRFRRRGLQRALIAARAKEAIAAGAETLFVITEFGGQSFWNQRAMGLELAYFDTEWRRTSLE